MGVFYITRPQFIDRMFTIEELGLFVEMLRLWYHQRAGEHGNEGHVHLEAWIYAIPRSSIGTISSILELSVPHITFDTSDPDQLKAIGPATPAGESADIAVWKEVLAQKEIPPCAVIFRATFVGPVKDSKGWGIVAPCHQTFVLCGARQEGSFLVKGIWELGLDESMQLVYRLAPPPEQAALLEAFDEFRQDLELESPKSAAEKAYADIRQKKMLLFMTRPEEEQVLKIVRQKAELPDDRGPVPFLRRLCKELALGFSFVAVALQFRSHQVFALLFGFVGLRYLLLGVKIFAVKVARVAAYRTAMRRAFNALYAGEVLYEMVDLSSDRDPTLFKYSSELERLGARHVCDFKLATPAKTNSTNRVYCFPDMSVSLSTMRGSQKLFYFPALPILILSTRFKDGKRHITMNRPRYRKSSRPEFTGRCLAEEAGLEELLDVHRRELRKLVDAGAVIEPPETTADSVVSRMKREHEEARETWQKSPYSWIDGTYEAFKVCRKEYRVEGMMNAER